MSLARSRVFRYFAASVLAVWLILLTGFLVTRRTPIYTEHVLTPPSTAQDAKYDAILAELERLRDQVASDVHQRSDRVPEVVQRPTPVPSEKPHASMASSPLPSQLRVTPQSSQSPASPEELTEAGTHATVAKRDLKQQPSGQGTGLSGVPELLTALDTLLHGPGGRELTYAVEELGISEGKGRGIYLEAIQLARSRWTGLEGSLTTYFPRDSGTSCAGRAAPQETAPFSVLVVGSGSGYISMMIAQTYPMSIVLSMEKNETLMWYHRRNLERTSTTNDVVVASQLDADAIHTLWSSSAFFRFSIVTDFGSLLDELLPHELERPMGQLLQMAQTSFVFKPDSSTHDLRHDRFFDYWNSFDAFLRESIRKAGMEGARVTSLNSGLRRVDIASLTEKQEGRPFKKCVKQSGFACEETATFALSFVAPTYDSPLTSFHLSNGEPLHCSGIPVDLLLSLDLYPESMSQLFTQLAFVRLPRHTGPVAPLVLAAGTQLTQKGVEVVPAYHFEFEMGLVESSQVGEPQQQAVASSSPAPRSQAVPSPRPLPSLVPSAIGKQGVVDIMKDADEEGFGMGVDSLTRSAAFWADDEEEMLNDEDQYLYTLARSTWDDFVYDDGDLRQQREEDAASFIRKLQEQYQNIDDDEEDLFNAFPYESAEVGLGRKLLAVTREIAPSPTPRPLHMRTIRDISVTQEHISHLLDRAVIRFEEQWALIRQEATRVSNPRGSWLVSNTGVSLLAGKLAKRFPAATVVAVDPSDETVDHQVDMAQMLHLGNLLVAQGDVASGDTVNALQGGTTIFRHHVLDLSVLLKPTFSSNQESLCSRFGQLATLAGTTYVIVPDDSVALAALSLFGRAHDETLPSLAQKCAERFGAQVHVDLVKGDSESIGKLLRIELVSFDRHLELSHDRHYRKPVVLEYRASGHSASVRAISDELETDCSAFSLEMVDVASLLALGLDDEYRSALASHYLQADLREDMNPAFLFWPAVDRPLSYCNPESGERQLSRALRAEEAHYDEVGRALVEDIQTREFTFLHLNSGKGDLSKWIAWLRPESTVVSIETEVPLFESHHWDVEEELLYNNLVCNSVVDAELMELIGRSPEFFEYGMFSNVLSLLRKHGFDWIKETLSGAMRLSRSSYVELPTASLLSLAYATIFPEQLDGKPVSYRLASHPMPLWEKSSQRLLGAFIDAEGLDQVALSFVPSHQSTARELVRIDIVSMMRQVRHHFLLPRHEFKETHSRTYMLHHHAAGMGPAIGPTKDDQPAPPPTDKMVNAPTYLVRDDGSSIIYDEFGITLIAALRLGVHPETKERLYHQFMRMGMREDMAPWNIQFKAGQLLYVDKDSGHFDFEAHLPYVYQVLLAMINYKSTVQVFDHCGQNTKLKYDVPVINFCVGAENIPACDDLALAVPCADGKCYSTFVGCLRALSELEESTQQELLSQVLSGGDVENRDNEEQLGVWVDGALKQVPTRNTRLTFL